MVSSKSIGQKFYKTPIRWIALIIGSIALIAEIVLSEEWAHYNGQDDWLAVVMAITFVGFTNLIFEHGYGLFIKGRMEQTAKPEVLEKDGGLFIRKVTEEEKKQRKQNIQLKYFGGTLCILLALLMELYNIGAIVGAQYNALIVVKQTVVETPKTQSKETIATKKQTQTDNLNTATNNLKELKAQFDLKTTNYKKLLRVDYKDLTPLEIGNLAETKQYNLDSLQYQEDKKKEEADQKTARANLDFLADAKDTTDNVKYTAQILNHGSPYTYFSKLTGIEELYLQFWYTAIPALFLGLISGLSLALFIYGKKES